jgi:3-oxoadipate enol-lactonase
MRAFLCCAIALVAADPGLAQTLSVPGARIPYEVRGTGAPVVFIHGYTQNMSVWDEQLPPFSAKYRMIRYDVRGFGKSTGHMDETANAADLAALLDSLRIERAAIVGLSMGAAIALNFAVNYPARVSALVLYGAPPTSDFPVAGPPDLYALFTTLPAIAKAHGMDSVRKVLFASELAWSPPNRPDITPKLDKAWEGYSGRDLIDPKPPSGRVPPTRMTQINGVRVPTLVIHGDHELAWFRQFGDTLMGRLPDARRVIIANGGHGAHFAQPDAFNQAVLNFLSGVRIQ